MNTVKHIYAHKVKILPTKGQRETFDFWLRRCKVLYNVALEEKITYYKSTNKYLNLYEQKKELVDIKNFDESWKEVPNKPLQEIIFRVDNSFKTFFKGGGFPKFKSYLDTIEFVKEDVRLKGGRIYLPKIKQHIKCVEDVKKDWTSVKLTKKNDDYYLIFLYNEEIEINLENEDVLGVDMGLESLYTDSNGDKCKRLSKKLISNHYKRIMELNQSLAKKKKGSRKFKKVKKQLSKTYDKLTNTRKDYLHKESLKLVTKSEGVIALGDINVKSIIDTNQSDIKNKVGNKYSKKGMVKSFYLNSLGIFKQYVIYKSIKHNKLCLLINEKMTSKTCSCCGNIKYDLKLNDRTYSCLNCGNSIDRDENSAVNMKMLGSSSLSKGKLVSL